MKKIIAIDFDGTIVSNDFPEIGKEFPDAIDTIKKLKEVGYKIILWTCRTGQSFNEAKAWLDKRDLYFHAYNEHLENEFKVNGRKVFADIYIDDRSFPPFDGDWKKVELEFL